MFEEVEKMTKKMESVGQNRSLVGLGRSRPGRAEVKGVKTDPGRARGGPSMTKNGHL